MLNDYKFFVNAIDTFFTRFNAVTYTDLVSDRQMSISIIGTPHFMLLRRQFCASKKGSKL